MRSATINNSGLAGLALIFDMDGVIIDSGAAHREAWVAFNRRFGLETAEAQLDRTHGWRNDDIVRCFYGDGLSAEEVAARGAGKEALYRELIADRVETMLVPGIRRFLQRHRHAPIGLASNAEPRNVEFVLERAGLRPYFRALVDGHQVSRPKPDPEIYLRAAALLETAPANCIVFEDSVGGVAAARAAGMRVAGITTGRRDLPGADCIAQNFLSLELDSWLGAQKPVA
jgi:beta-phosphoglucomutase